MLWSPKKSIISSSFTLNGETNTPNRLESGVNWLKFLATLWIGDGWVNNVCSTLLTFWLLYLFGPYCGIIDACTISTSSNWYGNTDCE